MKGPWNPTFVQGLKYRFEIDNALTERRKMPRAIATVCILEVDGTDVSEDFLNFRNSRHIMIVIINVTRIEIDTDVWMIDGLHRLKRECRRYVSGLDVFPGTP